MSVSPQPSPRSRQWISFAIRVSVTLLLFAFLFKSLSWSTLLVALTHVHLAVLPVAVVVGVFSLVVSAYQWQSLLRSERIHIDLAKLINLYLVGMAFSHFLPTGMGGDVVKAFYVGRESGNSAGSASAVVMSRVTGFFGMMLVAFPALIIWHAHFTRNIVLLFVSLSLGVGSMIVGAVFSARLLPRLFNGQWAKRRLFASAIRIGD
ncbi:MAG TPA: lysylphosphatidylglycerol synthase transmembrane domain-containing protein, partial [Ktedonobacteraceae bacterium]|nr:lysylphosphatidylglycerol synthase transmembrane domain-containing protein [Ktedonobacteraceae bacterium]